MENEVQKPKSKKKKSKKTKSADTTEGSESVEQLHTLKQSLPECSVTVTEVKKAGKEAKKAAVKEAAKNTVKEVKKQTTVVGTKAEVYSLSDLQEKILAFADKNDKNGSSDSSEKTKEVDLNKFPEITVIRNEPKPPNDNKPTDNMPEQQTNNANTEENKPPKKKRNKRKKKSVVENPETENNNANNNSVNNVTSEPTYVKLPSTGDACVLVVSHENFGSSSAERKTEDITLRNIAAQNSGLQAFPSNISCLPNTNPPNKIGTNNNQVQTGSVVTDKGSSQPGVSGIPMQDNSQEKAKIDKKGKESQKGKNPKPLDDSSAKDAKSKPVKGDVKKSSQHKSNLVSLFSHLPPYKPISSLYKHLESDSDMVLSTATVGMQSAEGIISGPDARCISVLAALEEIIKNYQTPLNKELSRDLDAKCQLYVASIGKFRPLSVSMLNAIKYLKVQITSITPSMSDSEAKQSLISSIRKFVFEEIYLAKKAICECASAKIVDGDVILTYGNSDVVRDSLCIANSQGKHFKVIVVDSKPKLEGREMLESLLRSGLQCSYMLIGGISYVMKEVTKVFIGAHSLLANGYVMATIGSSQVALIASAFNVPFLVCCETYKFCERVHTDSFDYNELGDPDSFDINLKKDDSDADKGDQNSFPNLKLLNVLYDITPPTLVSMVITEKGVLPCTSVPVLLRVRHSGIQD